jgi:hypothetical protein
LADLPPDLLGRVIALLPFPTDRARFRAVCRSWRSALRRELAGATQLPWILHSDGTIVTLPYHDLHTWSPFPAGTKLIGATGSWAALYRTDADDDGRRRYLLHDPFSNTTVPLPALDSVIGKVPDLFQVKKVLMRSTEDDLVAVMTNMRNHRIILCRPRKPGAWLLKRRVLPYACISDIAFHGDSLYGVTKNADLIALELGERKLTPSAVRSLMDDIDQRWNSPRPLNTVLHITPRCSGISRHFWGVIFSQLAAYPNQTSAAVFLIRTTRERSGSLRPPRDGDSAAVVRPVHDDGSALLHSTVDSGQRPCDGGT